MAPPPSAGESAATVSPDSDDGRASAQPDDKTTPWGRSIDETGSAGTSEENLGPWSTEIASDDAFESVFAQRLPERIGNYRIIRLIGQGGMGAVYEAEQQQPRRNVALKVIRAGILSRSLLRRFTFEVELLGRLQHPGIARIYEAGTAETDAGVQPYFAMEFVNGRPLAAHAYGLEAPRKLELMALVADAVHFAHQNGVIHRDLKPDNILVDEHGQPKVLDFGVARSTNADVQMTVETAAGAVVGTLTYMSPEQAAGESHHVDVRADVYALGVITYQVLTDQLPYELPRHSLVSALHVIRESDPLPVSRHNKDFAGDIDAILTKAMEKERTHRYQSAHDFAADIRRHLNHEPVAARPADTLYHLSRFVRRNRPLVAGVAATFVMLLGGLGGTSWQWIRAVQHRDEAEQHERDAQVKLAASYIAEGNALALAGRWTDAKDRHLLGLETANALGETVLPAQFALWEDRHHSPEALGVWQATSGARVVSFSADGLHALSGGGSPRIWDVARGTTLSEILCSDQRGAASVAYVEGEDRVILGTGWGSVRLWDLEKNDYAWTQPTHGAPVTAVAWIASEGGPPRIVSVALDHSIAVWDPQGNLLGRFGPPPPDRPFGATGQEGSSAISPDGNLAAVGELDGNVTVWSTTDGSQVARFKGHEGTVHGMTFSPDGRFLLTGSADKSIRLWSASDWRQVQRFEGHDNGVASVAMSSDGALVLSGSWDMTVRLWDSATGRLLRTFTGHTDAPRGLAFSPDCQMALSAGADGTIRSWSLRPGRQIRALAPTFDADQAPPHVNYAAVSRDGRLIASASDDGAIRLWDAATGLLLRTIPAHDGPALAVAFTPDGETLASTGATDGALKLWAVYPGEAPVEPLQIMKAPEPRVRWLSIAPDGRTAVTGGVLAVPGEPNVGVARVWDLSTGEMLREYDPGAGEIVDLHHSPDGALVVSAFEDSSVDLWDPKTGRQVARLSKEGGFQDVNTVAFDPTGTLVAGGGWGRIPRVWSAVPPYTADGPLAGPGHGSTMMSAVFTPDGRYLVTGGWDNAVVVWDMERRSMVRSLASHDRSVVSVAAGADGRLVVSASWDGSLRLWDFSGVTDFDDQRAAAEAATKTLQARPDDGPALSALGAWYARRGADGLAVRVLRLAAERGERVSNLLLARCHHSLGDFAQARLAYEHALALSEAPAPYIRLCLEALEQEAAGE